MSSSFSTFLVVLHAAKPNKVMSEPSINRQNERIFFAIVLIIYEVKRVVKVEVNSLCSWKLKRTIVLFAI